MFVARDNFTSGRLTTIEDFCSQNFSAAVCDQLLDPENNKVVVKIEGIRPPKDSPIIWWYVNCLDWKTTLNVCVSVRTDLNDDFAEFSSDVPVENS